MSSNRCDIHDLLNLFNETLTASEVLSSKLMSQISSTITKERIKLRMSQKDFAGHLGVTQSEISRWEHGDYNFSLKKIAEIAEKLDMDIDIIFTQMSIKKNIDYESFSNSPSTHTVVYSSTDSFMNRQFHKIKTEDFKYASICK